MIYVCVVLLLLDAYLLWQSSSREQEWRAERKELIQRIQAPEIAVQQFQDRPEVKRVAPIPVDDDEAFVEHKESLNGHGD